MGIKSFKVWSVHFILTLFTWRFGVLSAEQCPFPGIPANAVARNGRNESISWQKGTSFSVGQRMTFYCLGIDDQPFRFAGEIRCRDDGTWNASLPTCDLEVKMKVTHLSGDKYPEYPLQCNGNSTRFYLEWLDKKIPTKWESYTVYLEHCSNEIISNVSSGYRNQTHSNVKSCEKLNSIASRSYLCETQFLDKGKTYIELERSGSLNSARVFVKGKHCGWPPVPVHGNVKGNWSPGANSVEYECNKPFELLGNGSNSCDQTTGQWGPLPRCTCPLPREDFLVTRIRDKSVTFSCKNSLTLNGSDLGTCDASTGQWKSPLPTCTCQPPMDSHFHCSSINETTCEYQCNEILGLSGRGFLSCDRNFANWSTPVCQCEAPTIPNGIAEWNEPNFNIKCDNWFELVGSNDLPCDPTKGLSDLPKCQLSSVLVALICISLLILITAIGAIFYARKNQIWCWREQSVPIETDRSMKRKDVNVDRPTSEGIYANIIDLKVHNEPVYAELAFKSRSGKSVRAKATNGDTDHTSEIIYAAIKPKPSTRGAEEVIYAQIDKSSKMNQIIQ